MSMSHRFRLCKGAVLSVFISVGAMMAPAFSATLLLQYQFDEPDIANPPALDTGTAPPAPGLFTGGAARVTDTPGGFSAGALSLLAAGGGTFVDGGDADKLDGLSAFTLTAWVNLQDFPGGNLRIVAKQAAAAFEGFSWNFSDPRPDVGARTAASFGLRLFVGGTNAFAFDPVPTGLSIDADHKWAFVAVSYDGNNFVDNTNYYVGGVDTAATLASTTSIGAGATLPSSARFGVGFTDAAPAADTAPPGYLDDVRVYDGVLSEAELEQVRRENVIPEPATGAFIVLAGALLARRRPLRGQ
jgi:hypothetical protein